MAGYEVWNEYCMFDDDYLLCPGNLAYLLTEVDKDGNEQRKVGSCPRHFKSMADRLLRPDRNPDNAPVTKLIVERV